MKEIMTARSNLATRGQPQSKQQHQKYHDKARNCDRVTVKER